MEKKGFTIIELLVVIAIIAILVSISLVLFGGPRAKSRDARREADMTQIRNALGLYASNNGTYPICDTTTTINGTTDCLSDKLINAKAISAVPTDPMQSGSCGAGWPPDTLPLSNHVYCYRTTPDGTAYAIYYNRETSDNKPVGWNFITP
ncbi:MAG: type II secretion system protein [Patescibacteria group bacterium]